LIIILILSCFKSHITLLLSIMASWQLKLTLIAGKHKQCRPYNNCWNEQFYLKTYWFMIFIKDIKHSLRFRFFLHHYRVLLHSAWIDFFKHTTFHFVLDWYSLLLFGLYCARCVAYMLYMEHVKYRYKFNDMAVTALLTIIAQQCSCSVYGMWQKMGYFPSQYDRKIHKYINSFLPRRHLVCLDNMKHAQLIQTGRGG